MGVWETRGEGVRSRGAFDDRRGGGAGGVGVQGLGVVGTRGVGRVGTRGVGGGGSQGVGTR